MAKKSKIAVSVIVPVYNVSTWLARCLGSITSQTLKSIEIICIDDKSTDNSLSILQKWEKHDKRIKVIALAKNSGASVARNAGLAMATGEYMGFVDSDDYVDSDFYKRLYDAATGAGADIAKGEVMVVEYDGYKHKFWPKLSDIAKNKFYFIHTWWSAIYKNDMIKKRKLAFDEGIIVCQDVIFLLKAVFYANKVELVGGTNYYYVRREDSLDSKTLSTEKVKSNVVGFNLIIDFINGHIKDSETYSFVYKNWIDYLMYSVMCRNNTVDGRMAAIRGAIELYGKCKFPEEYNKTANLHHVKMLANKDEIGLFRELGLAATDKTKSWWKLFNLVPILKVKTDSNTSTMRLFGFIPLLKIRKKANGNYCSLFFILPVLMQRIAK
jgi:glycosyltransferase involved in cell wall biosynthesis